MVIKLISEQIPQFWEAIKFTAIQAGGVDEANYTRYTNEVLHSLLSDKSQCFIMLEEKRELVGIAITQIKIETYGQKKLFEIKWVYFLEWTPERFQQMYNYIVLFARTMNCSHVGFDAIDNGKWKDIEALGMTEYKRYYLNELGK